MQFAQSLVRRAEGVFLWVSLAVKGQIEGIKNDDDLEMLEIRLRTLPTEIEEVYAHLLNRMNKIWAAQIIHFVLQGIFSSTAKGLFWDPSILDVALSFKEMDRLLDSDLDICVTDVLSQCQRTERRLLTTCFGFLDGSWDDSLNDHFHFREHQLKLFRSGNAIIKFLHRSVADFFQGNGTS